MSITSVTQSPWWPTTNGTAASSGTQATSTSSGAGIAATSAGNPATAGAISSGDPTQQLSAELQAFLVQLQGGGGAAPGTTAAQPGTSATSAGTDPAGTGTVSGTHHRHHHQPRAAAAGQDPTNGPSGATGTAANTSDQGGATGPVRTFANSLVADVAQALRSYGTAASASSPASAMSSGLALAA